MLASVPLRKIDINNEKRTQNEFFFCVIWCFYREKCIKSINTDYHIKREY